MLANITIFENIYQSRHIICIVPGLNRNTEIVVWPSASKLLKLLFICVTKQQYNEALSCCTDGLDYKSCSPDIKNIYICLFVCLVETLSPLILNHSAIEIVLKMITMRWFELYLAVSLCISIPNAQSQPDWWVEEFIFFIRLRFHFNATLKSLEAIHLCLECLLKSPAHSGMLTIWVRRKINVTNG